MSSGSELSCDNCGEGHGPDDIFCENCGYDFITGSLPSADEQIAGAVVPDQGLTPLDEPIPGRGGQGEGGSSIGSGGASSEAPNSARSGASVPMPTKLRFSIHPDRAYFDAVVSEGELEYPEPPPAGTEIDVHGIEFHIGRTSQSRAIHPDLDIADLTGDPAVSSRHAVVRVAADGSLSVTDVGSTNGTFLGEVDSKAIKVGEVVPLEGATPIFVGAWTRLEISKVEG